jgi:ATP-dependent DNA ligase
LDVQDARGKFGATSSSCSSNSVIGVREELPVKEAILDGEVVALDSDGRQNFRDLLACRGNLHYAAF